jgi:hypothetical protein
MVLAEYFSKGWLSKKVTKTALTGLTVTVDADARTLTRDSGDFGTDGIEVGDIITTTGFENVGNNDDFEVESVSGDVLTLKDPDENLVDVTDDTGVGVDPATKAVILSRCLLSRVKVLTDVITVTPKDDDTARWDTIIDDSEFDIGCTPLLFVNSLKATFSDDGSCWFFYKVI